MKVIKLNAESKTDRQERIEGWSQEVLREATALVLGAGAIGNELLKNLALTGFGYALICDMDRIERTAMALGMVPKDQVTCIRIQVPQEIVEEQPGAWERFTTFLSGLFA